MRKNLARNICLIQKENIGEDGTYYFDLELENNSFYNVNLYLDFSDCKKFRFKSNDPNMNEEEDTRPMSFNDVVDCCSSKIVAQLVGGSNWLLNFSIEYSLIFPPKEVLKQKNDFEINKLTKRYLETNKLVEHLAGCKFEEIIEEVNFKKLTFFDMTFPPNNVN